MKFIKSLFVALMLFNTVGAFAYQYSEQEKNYLYETFEKGYFIGVEKSLNENSNYSAAAKNRILNKIKQSYSRQALINSSWSCIQKYPMEQLQDAFSVCTKDWQATQVQITSKILAAENKKK